MEPVPLLTCERCKKRKMKCDKLSPCTACRVANIKCQAVQRARKPRGRSGIQKSSGSTLELRIARIESLLKRAETQASLTTDFASLKTSNGSEVPTQPRDRDDELLAPEFWTELSHEVSGLRETFESSDEGDSISETTSGTLKSQYSDKAILFGLDPIVECRTSLPHTTAAARSVLLDLYKQRVDCLFKLLHWPSVLHEIGATNSEPEYVNSSSSSRALEFSIYFMALCSIRENEAMPLELGNRSEMIERYRVATELLISDTNILRAPTLTALQAFVIYLMGLRAYQNSASAWTLLALAVRIASSLRLGHEIPTRFPPFQLELRRRLWYTIALLDVHASADRGTIPMLRYTDLGTPPLCINDDEMSPALVPETSSLGFNDMSFFEVMFKSMLCNHKLLSMPGNTNQEWKEKLQLVEHYESSMLNSYCHIGDSATLLERYAKFVVLEITPSMHLLLRRPPHKREREAVPAWDEFDVIEMSITVLQRHMDLQTAEFAPWAWNSWVKWHALAVLLAELASRPSGPETESQYLIACRSFNSFAHLVADSECGMLWKPIARLMRRVHRLRGQLPTSNSSLLPPPSVTSIEPDNTSTHLPNVNTGLEVNGLGPIPEQYEDFGSFDWHIDSPAGKASTEGESDATHEWNNPELSWNTFLDDTDLSYSVERSNMSF